MDWLPWWVIETALIMFAFGGLYVSGTNGNLLGGVFAMTTIIATGVSASFRLEIANAE